MEQVVVHQSSLIARTPMTLTHGMLRTAHVGVFSLHCTTSNVIVSAPRRGRTPIASCSMPALQRLRIDAFTTFVIDPCTTPFAQRCTITLEAGATLYVACSSHGVRVQKLDHLTINAGDGASVRFVERDEVALERHGPACATWCWNVPRLTLEARRHNYITALRVNEQLESLQCDDASVVRLEIADGVRGRLSHNNFQRSRVTIINDAEAALLRALHDAEAQLRLAQEVQSGDYSNVDRYVALSDDPATSVAMATAKCDAARSAAARSSFSYNCTTCARLKYDQCPLLRDQHTTRQLFATPQAYTQWQQQTYALDQTQHPDQVRLKALRPARKRQIVVAGSAGSDDDGDEDFIVEDDDIEDDDPPLPPPAATVALALAMMGGHAPILRRLPAVRRRRVTAPVAVFRASSAPRPAASPQATQYTVTDVESDGIAGSSCTMCEDRAVNVVCQPCGDAFCCRQCALLMQSAHTSTCAICRRPISSFSAFIVHGQIAAAGSAGAATSSSSS